MASRKLNFTSSDGVSFEVDVIVALQWRIIKRMLELSVPDGDIPLPKVTGEILQMVIEYSKKHVESSKSKDQGADEDLKAWDAEFVNVDESTLFDLMMVRFSPSFLFSVLDFLYFN